MKEASETVTAGMINELAQKIYDSLSEEQIKDLDNVELRAIIEQDGGNIDAEAKAAYSRADYKTKMDLEDAVLKKKHRQEIEVAAKIFLETKQASVSLLQRRMKIGYGKAARLVDEMEEMGIVGPFKGSKPREVMVETEEDLDEILKGITTQEGLEDPPSVESRPEDPALVEPRSENPPLENIESIAKKILDKLEYDKSQEVVMGYLKLDELEIDAETMAVIDRNGWANDIYRKLQELCKQQTRKWLFGDGSDEHAIKERIIQIIWNTLDDKDKNVMRQGVPTNVICLENKYDVNYLKFLFCDICGMSDIPWETIDEKMRQKLKETKPETEFNHNWFSKDIIEQLYNLMTPEEKQKVFFEQGKDARELRGILIDKARRLDKGNLVRYAIYIRGFVKKVVNYHETRYGALPKKIQIQIGENGKCATTVNSVMFGEEKLNEVSINDDRGFYDDAERREQLPCKFVLRELKYAMDEGVLSERAAKEQIDAYIEIMNDQNIDENMKKLQIRIQYDLRLKNIKRLSKKDKKDLIRYARMAEKLGIAGIDANRLRRMMWNMQDVIQEMMPWKNEQEEVTEEEISESAKWAEKQRREKRIQNPDKYSKGKEKDEETIHAEQARRKKFVWGLRNGTETDEEMERKIKNRIDIYELDASKMRQQQTVYVGAQKRYMERKARAQKIIADREEPGA